MDRHRWLLPGRRIALDWLVPVTILVIGVVNVTQHPHSRDYPGAPMAHLGFLAAAVAALGLRRRAPLVAPVVALAVVIWWSWQLWPADAQGPFEGFLVLVGAAYSIGASNTGRRLAYGIAILAVFFIGGEFFALAHGGRDGDLLPIAVWMVVALVIGYFIQTRTEQAHRARAAAAIIAAEQEQQTVRAVEEERARIARELHDVVAHGLSVIVVQAGAERRSLHSGPVDVDSVDAVLGSIERAGREAMVDLRRLLGLLRRSDGPPALAPQPGLAQLDDLLGAVREAGVQVDVAVRGERAPLPPGVDLTAYRIVQEALTNVLKHANARHVRIGVGYERTGVELYVVDDGGASVTNGTHAANGGHGLIGMRERVNVFGGTISTGPAEGGGWSVQARLPVTRSVADR
jgi:signal transduction histidine kinase